MITIMVPDGRNNSGAVEDNTSGYSSLRETGCKSKEDNMKLQGTFLRHKPIDLKNLLQIALMGGPASDYRCLSYLGWVMAFDEVWSEVQKHPNPPTPNQ